MSDMLSIGASGVRAYQTALTTVSDNIANASTPGYAKRTTDLSEIAPQFGVSRTHIRNILRAAKERGFIGHHGERRQFIRLMPAWITAFNRFMADSQAYSDLTYRLGLAALADHDAPLPA